MNYKDVHFNKDVQDKILEGINILGDAVGSTLGAAGSTVIYQDDIHMPGGQVIKGAYLTTKDGVTVANLINDQDKVKNSGIQLVKNAASQTAKKAGDGTTTSTILAQYLINKGFEYSPKISKRNFIDGIEQASKDVLKKVEEASIEVDNKLLKYVATISTNNDAELGDLISDAFEVAGEYGSIGYAISDTVKTYSDVEHGVKIGSGYMDPNFVNDKEKGRMVFEKPLIFLSTSTITHLKEIEPIVQYSVEQKRPLLIIANMDPIAAAPFAVNVRKSNMQFGIVQPPHVGLHQREIMEDLAEVTGATLHGAHLGDAANLVDESLLGTCDFSFSDHKSTVLRFEKKPNVDEKIKYLEHAISEETIPDRKKQFKNRLANIAGAIGMIYVGGPTPIEIKEKADRIEDAIHAVDAAKEEGIIPGGGVALRDISFSLRRERNTQSDFNSGYNLLLDAINQPYHKIITNAKLEVPSDLDPGYGIDVLDGKSKDMFKSGIIDPAMVTKEALSNATSVAKTILDSGVLITTLD